ACVEEILITTPVTTAPTLTTSRTFPQAPPMTPGTDFEI
ncbi:unnamed protein product, partial [Rotaria sordida]